MAPHLWFLEFLRSTQARNVILLLLPTVQYHVLDVDINTTGWAGIYWRGGGRKKGWSQHTIETTTEPLSRPNLSGGKTVSAILTLTSTMQFSLQTVFWTKISGRVVISISLFLSQLDDKLQRSGSEWVSSKETSSSLPSFDIIVLLLLQQLQVHSADTMLACFGCA